MFYIMMTCRSWFKFISQEKPFIYIYIHLYIFVNSLINSIWLSRIFFVKNSKVVQNVPELNLIKAFCRTHNLIMFSYQHIWQNVYIETPTETQIRYTIKSYSNGTSPTWLQNYEHLRLTSLFYNLLWRLGENH